MNKRAAAVNRPSPDVAQASNARKNRFTTTRWAEDKVIDANQKFYARFAPKYEQYESCVFDRYLQGILATDIERIHAYFDSRRQTPECLDCGGGTGNLSLRMLAKGWNVTVVDASCEMLAVLEEKARVAGFRPRLLHGSLERFFQNNIATFDLVAFSSVLHHLYAYRSVIERAAPAVRPGGFFYSNYDPALSARPALRGALDSLDIALAKVFFDPVDLLPGVYRRLRKLFTPFDSFFQREWISAGDLAEYHARTGLDDSEIVKTLRRNGLAIVEHRRYPAGRTAAFRFLNQRFRLLQYFKVIARRERGFGEAAAAGSANQTTVTGKRA